jgi:hypothetical protein
LEISLLSLFESESAMAALAAKTARLKPLLPLVATEMQSLRQDDEE